MSSISPGLPTAADGWEARAENLYDTSLLVIRQRADRMFSHLMIIQWLAGIAAAVWISPRTWIGATSSIHWHIWAAVFLGGAIISLPVLLARKLPGHVLTRHTIAVAQMLTSALLIHLTGGRIETHFHVFGSLAFIAFYRDWRVLLTATLVVAMDHIARGLFWPQSVFGVLASSPWRWLEHAGWVLFEDTFLFLSIRQGLRDLREVATRRAHLETVNAEIEQQVADRTIELTFAHTELQASESRFSSAFTDAAIGMALVSPEGRWLKVNRALCTLLGYSAEELCGKAFQDVTHPDDLEKGLEQVRLTLAGTINSYQIEKRYQHKEGAVVWALLSVSLVREAGGAPRHFIAQIQDITERKLAQKQLAESEYRLRSILATEPECVKLVAVDGTLLEMNPAGLVMVEAERVEQVVGKNVYGLVAPEHRSRFQTLNEAVFRGESRSAEFELIGLKGTRRWMETHACPLRDPDGQIYAQLAVTRDVTERKRAEQKILASLKEVSDLKSALDAAAIVDVTDAQGIITAVNDQWCAISQYSRAELLGQSHRLVNSGHHPTEFFATLWQTITQGKIWKGEVCNRTKDGTLFWVDTTVVPFLDETGKPFQYIVIRFDITERKRADAALAKAHQELVEVSRQAGMAEVATGVLHNVGNVLNSINVTATCVAESLRKSKAASLPRLAALLREHESDLGAFLTTDPRGKQIPEYLTQLGEHIVGEQAHAQEELTELRKHIDHIKDIVTMQQDFARVSGLTEIVNVPDLVEDALRMNVSSLMRHDVKVIKDFSPVPPITVEKHKVLQIIVNLLGNAKHACEAGNRDDKQVTLRVMQAADRVCIEVADNGVGIAPENMTRIFSHGFTTKKTGHGFGLHSGALAAQELGGALKVRSAGVGQGATFTVELPLQPREKSDA